MKKHQVSQQRVSRLFGISRCGLTYQSKKQAVDEEIGNSLQRLADRHPRWGFWKMFHRLRLDGHRWNHKRVWRIYRELGLNIRTKPKKRLPPRTPQPLALPEQPNQCWAADFMSDALTNKRPFRTLNIVDTFNREALWSEIDTSLPSQRLVRILDRIAAERGCYPTALRSDNGSEFTSKVMLAWADKHGVLLDFIEPGKPMQNGFMERFNRTYREEILDAYLFDNLDEVRVLTEQWLHSYNNERPHASLDGLTPQLFAQRQLAISSSA